MGSKDWLEHTCTHTHTTYIYVCIHIHSTHIYIKQQNMLQNYGYLWTVVFVAFLAVYQLTKTMLTSIFMNGC